MERHRGGETRDADQRQLTQLANSAWAAGLCLLMAGRRDESREWLRRAAARYRESFDAGAPEGSWGRPIAAMKALLLAGDDAAPAARWALDAGAAEAEWPPANPDATPRSTGTTLQLSPTLEDTPRPYPHTTLTSPAAPAAGDHHATRTSPRTSQFRRAHPRTHRLAASLGSPTSPDPPSTLPTSTTCPTQPDRSTHSTYEYEHEYDMVHPSDV